MGWTVEWGDGETWCQSLHGAHADAAHEARRTGLAVVRHAGSQRRVAVYRVPLATAA